MEDATGHIECIWREDIISDYDDNAPPLRVSALYGFLPFWGPGGGGGGGGGGRRGGGGGGALENEMEDSN